MSARHIASAAVMDGGGDDDPTIRVEDQDALWIERDSSSARLDRVVLRSKDDGRDEEWMECSAPSIHQSAEGDPRVRVALVDEPIWLASVLSIARLDDGRFEGTVVAVGLDTLLIDLAESRQAVPARDVDRGPVTWIFA